jgi:hypothetical protein
MRRKLIIVIIILSLFAGLNIAGLKAAQGRGYLIKTIPAGARVYVNAKYLGITPYILTADNAEIRIAKGGYAEITQRITSLTGGETLNLKALRKRSALYLRGTLSQITYTVEEIPQTGIAPAIIDNLEAGNYTLLFSKKGFKSLTKNIVLKGGLTTLTINLTKAGIIVGSPTAPTIPPVLTGPVVITEPAGLTKEYSNATVNTNVSGCQIYLSGVPKGLSPLVLKNLEVGKTYSISAQKNGYNTKGTAYVVEKNGLVTLNLTIKSLAPATIKTTFLNIKSNIAASNIYVKGVNHIGDNITVYGLKVGSFVALKITKVGYITQTRTVTLKANGNYTSFTLEELIVPEGYISLKINSVPSGATVLLTGGPVEEKGTTPMELQELIVGRHYTLIVSKKGYNNITYGFTVKANEAPKWFMLVPTG